MKLVIHNEGRGLRGSERQIVMLAEGLTRRGHEVVVSCHPDGALSRELDRLRIRTTGIRPRGDADLFSAFRFAAFLRRERADAVLLTAWRRLFWSTAAARLAGVPRVVVRVGLVRRGDRRAKYRAAFRRVDAVIANSPEVAEVFRASLPDFPGRAVHVVRNATLPPTPAHPGTLRAELGIGADVRLAVSLGSLAWRKGHDLLLDAFDAVPDARLAIAGDGPAEAELRERAVRLGLDGRVRFLGSRHSVAPLLADADLFVLATRNDSLPNAMLEAMAAGVPVLVTDVGGVRTALEPTADRPAAGWLVPAEDPGALRAALVHAMSACRGPEGEALGREAAWRAREWFGPDRMVAAAEAVLLTVEAG